MSLDRKLAHDALNTVHMAVLAAAAISENYPAHNRRLVVFEHIDRIIEATHSLVDSEGPDYDLRKAREELMRLMDQED